MKVEPDITDILNQLERDMNEAFSKQTFLPEDSTGHMRKPNEREKRTYMLNAFRYIYYQSNGSIKKSQYNTMKACIKRSQYDIVYRFLYNHGFEIELGELETNFTKYSKSEVILVQHVRVTFQKPVRRCCINIDIEIDEGGMKDECQSGSDDSERTQ